MILKVYCIRKAHDRHLLSLGVYKNHGELRTATLELHYIGQLQTSLTLGVPLHMGYGALPYLVWSGWPASNRRPEVPKTSALPTAPHPD